MRTIIKKGMVLRTAGVPTTVVLCIVGSIVCLLMVGCQRRDKADPPEALTQHGSRLTHLSGQTGVEMDPDSLRLAGVTTIIAGVADMQQAIQPTGQVAAMDNATVQVTSRLAGKITQALVSVGSRVGRGQLVAKVDSVDLAQAEANYQTALAHARLSNNQLVQQRKLAQYGTLSEPAVEDARKTVAVAQAAVANDEEQLKVDRTILNNTRQLVDMGEITHKPVEDAQNAHAQAQSALQQAQVTLHSTKSNLARTRTLYDAGIYSKQQLEDAETSYNNAVAAADQNATQEKLAGQELQRQERIYKQDLNGASSLQEAQSKLQQDEHTYQNDLAGLDLAHKQLARAEVVRKSGIPVSQALQQAQDTYDEARIAVQSAADTLRLYGVTTNQALAQLHNGRVVIPVFSPISGIVTATNMVVGQIVDTGTPLAKVVNLDRVFVDAQVYEKDLLKVAVGSPTRLNIAALPDRAFSGKVLYIGNEVSSDTRTITVRTVLPNPGGTLRPGMFATVFIGSRKPQRTVVIPPEAVLQSGVRQIVYVQVSPQEFVERTVKAGAAAGGRVPLYSGVSPGDRVVVKGNVLIEHELRNLENERRGTP